MRFLNISSVFSASAQLFGVLHFMFLFLSSAYAWNTFSLPQTDLQPVPHCSVFRSEVIFTREPSVTSAGWHAHHTVLGFLEYLLIITKGLVLIEIWNPVLLIFRLSKIITVPGTNPEAVDGWTTERKFQDPGQFPRPSFTLMVPEAILSEDSGVILIFSLGLSTAKNTSYPIGWPS